MIYTFGIIKEGQAKQAYASKQLQSMQLLILRKKYYV